MTNSAAQVALIIALVLMSGFFSATETAFSCLSRSRLKNLADHGDLKAEKTLRLADRYDELLNTILVGNNIVNIAMASIGTILFVRWIGSAGVTVSTAVITIAVLIFGEITPKSLAKEAPEKWAMSVTSLMSFLTSLMHPLNVVFSCWKRFLQSRLHVEDDHGITSDELLTIVEEAQQEGDLDAEDTELVKSAIEFRDLDVSDILIPRVRVEGIPADSTIKEAEELFDQSGYSRMPVYEETLDHITGIVHQKDLYSRLHKAAPFTLQDIMKKPVYVPPTAKLSDTLRLLQKTQSQMAVVSDEYGGTEGIVSMEDILEELVGEIWDEHDEVEEAFRQSQDGKVWNVLGSADPDELFEMLNLNETTEASTVSGWVMEKTETIPRMGDSFSVPGWSVTVTRTDGRYVQEIKVVPEEKKEEQSEEE